MNDQSNEQLDKSELGRSMADQLDTLHITAQQWQDTNPSVIDYRVTDLITHLRRAAAAARLLADEDHSEEWKTALAGFWHASATSSTDTKIEG